jgi:hypothetical protein
MQTKWMIIGTIGAIFLTVSGCDSDRIKEAPYDKAPHIDTATQQQYLDLINEARNHGRDCGHYKMENGEYVLDENGSHITVHDGSSEDWRDPADRVKWNDKLYQAAAEHNADMVYMEENIMHDGTGTASDHTAQVNHLGRGSHFEERLLTNGYKYTKALENITAGTDTDTAQKAIDRWLESAGHCKNLMDPDITEVGLAYEHNESTVYKYYWTMELAKPAREAEGVF